MIPGHPDQSVVLAFVSYGKIDAVNNIKGESLRSWFQRVWWWLLGLVRLGLWCGRAPWQRGSSGARLLTQWNQR